MINNLGWGSFNESPIRVAIGTRSTAAIVCEILCPYQLPSHNRLEIVFGLGIRIFGTHKVAITKAMREKMIKIE